MSTQPPKDHLLLELSISLLKTFGAVLLENLFKFAGESISCLVVDVEGDDGLTFATTLSETDVGSIPVRRKLTETVSMTMSFRSNQPVSRQVSFTIWSSEGDTESFFVFVDIRDRSPKITRCVTTVN